MNELRALFREFRELIRQDNEIKRLEFWGPLPFRGRYTERQKTYALEEVSRSGVRATSRILGLNRRTLQRWLRDRGIQADRHPPWMDEWRKRKIRRRRYFQYK